jgi:hypothetical protein
MISKMEKRFSERSCSTKEESRTAFGHPALLVLNVLRACRAAEKLNEAEA